MGLCSRATTRVAPTESPPIFRIMTGWVRKVDVGLDSRLRGNDGVECGDDGGVPVVFGCVGVVACRDRRGPGFRLSPE